ncbi:MAG: methylenetetrahydrofolate reductase C-terminal domain-containing protein [Betaproteobacteria bacterium]|nr:methylenetetrahydrofolate reductase C-terminal domain-containing protein [Betaproteobacteria bacterium]
MKAGNALAEALANGRFFWSLEFIPSVDRILRDDLTQLGGIAAVMRGSDRLVTFAVTDRVVSERDPEPVAAAASLGDSTGKQPLVHFSGKGRELGDLERVIGRMQANGLENMLVLTGDRIKLEPVRGRARYLESVPALAFARHLMPRALLACALNPFKYREEEGMAQFYKLDRKMEAGADLAITQIGFDPAKHDDAIDWVRRRCPEARLVANVMLLPAARARYMRKHALAGITITDSLMAMLEAEAALPREGAAARALRRLALQIVGVELAGYAGVQITGLHAPERVEALNEAVCKAGHDCPDRASWNEAWQDALTAPDGSRADPVPLGARWRLGQRGTAVAGFGERFRYRALEGIHRAVFERGPLAACFGAAMRPFHGKEGTLAGRAIHFIERAVKAPIVGCETCGQCRLGATQFVCPETCPKGLANGPCGGTTLNRCEFGDRECIHSVKLRLAAAAGVEEQLGSGLIAAVPAESRNRTSWPSHFAGDGTLAERRTDERDRAVRGPV